MVPTVETASTVPTVRNDAVESGESWDWFCFTLFEPFFQHRPLNPLEQSAAPTQAQSQKDGESSI